MEANGARLYNRPVPRANDFGQPIGPAVSEWAPRPLPEPVVLEGTYVRLEPIKVAHAKDIRRVLASRPDLWTYLREDPPEDDAEAVALVERLQQGPNVTLAVIRRADESFQGRVAIMRADPAYGTVEIGSIMYAPDLQRTPATTEVTHLVADHLFGLGYRRFEWKCDSLNATSRRAARRLGFTEEGTFRNAVIYKGRSRDTTWFSITDGEWPRIRAAHRRWLDPDNFDAAGQQRTALGEQLHS